jgi:hypothetical protein
MASPPERLVKNAVIAALFGAGLALAPTATAAPAPPPPGPPPGYDGLPYHNMPGRIGHQPGAYTYILGFYLRPRRVLDTAGIAAMSNTDLKSSEFGLPSDELGVEPTRRSWTGNVPGVRAGVPMEAAGSTDAAAAGKSHELSPGGESTEPGVGGSVEPESQNAGPDPDPGVTK